jgi:prevent-host-death family protein
MESIGAYEAKTHLPKLLERVARGEKIIITKHGVPVAILQPIDPQQRSDPRRVIEQIKEFRTENRLDGVSLRELIEEGKR